MAPPMATETTNGVSSKDDHGGVDFEHITITGFYSKDIRFPVRSITLSW